jgi:hypothetical protein
MTRPLARRLSKQQTHPISSVFICVAYGKPLARLHLWFQILTSRLRARGLLNICGFKSNTETRSLKRHQQSFSNFAVNLLKIYPESGYTLLNLNVVDAP